MLDECMPDTATDEITAYGPNVVGRYSHHSIEEVGIRPDVGAVNYLPRAFVPSLHEGLAHTVISITPNGPNGAIRWRRYRIEGIRLNSDVRAGHNIPCVAVPSLHQGLVHTVVR